MAGTTITLPPGAFAAAKSGQPQPAQPSANASGGAAGQGKEAPPPKVSNRTPAPKPEEAKAQPKANQEPPKDATAAEKKIWKIKAAGKEVEFDASDEETVKQHIAKALGADDTFKSAAQLRRQAEQFFEMLRNPSTLRQVLSDPRVGIDVQKWAEQQVWEQIEAKNREEEFKKDPAKKKAWEDEQELKRLRDKETSDKAAAEQKKIDDDAARWAADYDKKITRALELSRVPKDERSVNRMIHYIETALDQNLDLSPEDIVAQVHQDYIDDLGAIIQALDGDQLLEWLGEAGSKKVREADMKRLRDPKQHSFPKRSDARRAADSRSDPAPKRKPGSEWKESLIKDFMTRAK